MAKIFLYFSSNSTFYTNLYPSVKKGFSDLGHEVIGDAHLLEPEALVAQIKREKPLFVFETNRVKSEIDNFPSDTIHICWLLDFWGRSHDQLHGSDILFTLVDNWRQNFPPNTAKKILYLPPGSDLELYHPTPSLIKYSMLFLGHLSKKWTQQELSRYVGKKNNKRVLFKDILPHIHNYINGEVLARTDTNHNKEPVSIYDFLRKDGIRIDKNIDSALIYDINSRSVRYSRRLHFLNKCFDKKNSLAIFGNKHWKEDDTYSPMYHGFLTSPQEINTMINQSNILLHDGDFPHFRTFDAMAAGTPIAVAYRKNHSSQNEWEELGFEANKDYIQVDINGPSQLSTYLSNTPLLNKIADNARNKILSHHSWMHRASYVLQTIDTL